MNGKDFEKILIDRMAYHENRGEATMSRYGTKSVFQRAERGEVDIAVYAEHVKSCVSPSNLITILTSLVIEAKKTVPTFRPVQSLPDFEGVLAPSGRQFVIECKVSNQASLNLQDSHFSDRQLKHLLTRAQFGAISILLIHFPERILKTRTDERQTWAFPVFAEHQFWQLFSAGSTKSISRDDCHDYAVLVPWNCTLQGRTERPDLLSAIRALAEEDGPKLPCYQ